MTTPRTTPDPLLTVEVHDVSPATAEEVDRILEALDGLGLGSPTLLVVPSHEDATGRPWPLEDAPQLVEALHARARAGAEIVQHGLTHRAPGPPPRGLGAWLMHHLVSRGEAEFAHLPRAEAVHRLAEGRARLAACGFGQGAGAGAPAVLGFVAPVWQQSPGAFRAVAEAGFAFTAFLDRVVPLVGTRDPIWAPALTFCAPGALVDHGKRLAMRGVEAFGRDAPLLRLAIHPEDARAPGRLAHILARLRELRAERRVVRYAEWLVLDEGAPVGVGRRRAGARARAWRPAQGLP